MYKFNRISNASYLPKFTDVSDALKVNDDLTKDCSDFAAFAIILQDKFKNYPASLKTDLMQLAASNKNAKLIMSKINGVSDIHLKLVFN